MYRAVPRDWLDPRSDAQLEACAARRDRVIELPSGSLSARPLRKFNAAPIDTIDVAA